MLHLENDQQTRIITDIDSKFWPKERLEANVVKFAKKYPNKIAIKDRWKSLTYQQLDKKINDLAINMSRHGIKENFVVMFQLPNIVESMIVFHATLRVGAIALPIPTNYRESEINSVIKQVSPDLIFIVDHFRNQNYVNMYEKIEDISSVPIVRIIMEDEPGIDSDKFIHWNKMVENNSNKRLETRPFNSKEFALLIFSSGTTSDPKGILHTHETLGVAISNFDGIETISRSSVFFVPSPITHITGVVVGLLGPMKKGASAIFMPTWDANSAFEIIKQEKCNYVMAATPFLSQLSDVCEAKGEKLPSLKHFSCGGADVSEHLLKRAKAINPHCTFSRIYGSTEAPGISTFALGYDERKRFSKDGRPSYPAKAKLKTTETLNEDYGELYVYGPQLFMRYLSWEETENSFQEEWFQTGDLARMDDEGFIEITGREKDIIIRGGENYSAKEVEDILETHTNIEDIAIVGYPDTVMGERGCAFVVLKDANITLKLSDLTNLLEEKKVAKYKWPERLEIIDSIPYTHSGKQQKYMLREMINQ